LHDCDSEESDRQMTSLSSGAAPRKQRTRQHVIASQSVNYVERFIIDEGHTAQRMESDYGYDLAMTTFDGDGYAEPGLIYIQLKSAESLIEAGSEYVFDLDVRDYSLWLAEPMPVVLVLFDASRRRAFWLHVQSYFSRNRSRKPTEAARTVRVRVPKSQAISRRAIAAIRAAKQQVLHRLSEERKRD
jgi:hypothetical protein